MTLRNFNSRAEKLVKKSEIKFVDFTRNLVTLRDGSKIKFDPVMYRGEMRFAIVE
jgi:hypothetical protein